ncbi:MAG: cell division protein FtsZ [Thermoplasmata archaeon]
MVANYNSIGMESSPTLSVLVLGVGGAGCNSINRLSNLGIYGAETIAVNTDKEHLINVQADTRLLIGRELNRGLGAGGNPRVGEKCAGNAASGFKRLFKKTDLVFVTAGLGGGTGTGAAPVICEIAERCKSMVISIVTMPFSFEGRRKRKLAMTGLRRIEECSNSTIVLENDTLLKVFPDLPVDQGFGAIDSLISELIKSVTEIVTYPSLINLDFNDLRSVLGTGGVSTLMSGEKNIEDYIQVVDEASKNPFLPVDYKGAKKALIHLTFGNDLSVTQMNEVVEKMTSNIDPQAGVIFGARVDPQYQHKIKLMSVLTGLSMDSKRSGKGRINYVS